MAQGKYHYPPDKAELSYAESLDIMKMIHEHYRMDIEQIWKRGTVYLTISSALFALISSKDFDVEIPNLVFFSLGFIISLFWLSNSIISHRWISIWRIELTRIDGAINPYGSFERGEGKVRSPMARPQIYSVALPCIFLGLWLFLAISELWNPGA